MRKNLLIARSVFPVIEAKPHFPKRIQASATKVSIEAALPDGESEKGPRKFSIVAYTGGPLGVSGYEFPVIVDLRGLKSRNQVIANLDHDKTKRVGQVTDIQNDGKQLVLSGLLNAATDARKEVLESADDGFHWQASIEALPTQLEFLDKGKQATVNGQTFTGPYYIAKESTLTGVAFVGQGADDNTSARIAAAAAYTLTEGGMNFEAWVAAQGFDVSTLTEMQMAFLKKAYEKEVGSEGSVEGEQDPEKPVDGEQDPEKPVQAKFDIDGLKAAYAKHESKIEAALFQAEGKVDRVKLAELKAKAFRDAQEIKATALSKEHSPLQFEVAALRKVNELNLDLIRAERPVGPGIHMSQKDTSSPVIEAAMMQTLRIKDYEKDFKEPVLEAAHKQFKGRLGLQQVIIMAAASNGMPVGAGDRIHVGNIREILAHAFPAINAASTLSLPGIFSNVANKELLTGYMEEDQTWREIAVTKPVNDFKTVTSYRMLDSLEYEELGADGKIVHGELGEESYTRSVDTFAKMFSLTRKDIINDDLGAFDDLRTRLGRGAAMKFNRLFWATFMNNAAFFTSGRGNFISGATSNLGTDGVGLGLGVAAFRKLKTGTGDGAKRIGGNPDRLLVPPELEHVGDKLFMGEKLNIGSGPGEDNIYRNKYRPIVVPWLSDTGFTGNSATAWYLLRNPAILASIVVSLLNGNETPVVETAEADFDTLGVLFRGYHDFGFDLAEYLAGIKSKGAA